jgi:hypothetical protein
VLRAAPRDVTAALVSTCEDIDQARTKQRAQIERLDQLASRRQSLNPLARRQATGSAAEVRQALGKLDARLVRLREREASLRSLWRARNEWLESHHDQAERLQVVLRAERAREADIAAAARHEAPIPVLLAVGPEPQDHVARQAWEHAVVETAIHLDRFGRLDGDVAGLEAWSFQQASHAVRYAEETAVDRDLAAVGAAELEL